MIRSALPADLKTGILHLGLGAFHRAHQADFTQDAIIASGGDWGIEAVSMRNPAVAQALNRQDGHYTLIERAGDGPVLKDMTVIRRAHVLPGNEYAVAARMADPAIHIVTITVTEKGYGADIARRCLSPTDPAVRHDLAAPGEPPQSLVGLICCGLALRRAAGHGGMTLMSCDNLAENGQVLRAITLAFAQQIDAALAEWIDATCHFPSSMVDRITPAATDQTRDLAGGDACAIETEPFRHWVIEDDFAGPHPDWAAAGALIVPDVRPYEMMKLRLLNGAHSMLAYTGAVLGLPMVRDVMAKSDLAKGVRWHMSCVAQSLDAPPGFDLSGYIDALILRFENPAIAHRCLQIASDGSLKMPLRIFAAALDLIDRDQGVDSCAYVTAIWCMFLTGDQQVQDPVSAAISDLKRAANGDDAMFIAGLAQLSGATAQRLWAKPGWQSAVHAQLQAIRTQGAEAALRHISGQAVQSPFG